MRKVEEEPLRFVRLDKFFSFGSQTVAQVFAGLALLQACEPVVRSAVGAVGKEEVGGVPACEPPMENSNPCCSGPNPSPPKCHFPMVPLK